MIVFLPPNAQGKRGGYSRSASPNCSTRALPEHLRFIGIVDKQKFEIGGLKDSIVKFRLDGGESEVPLFMNETKAVFFGSIAFGDEDSKYAMYPLNTVGMFIEFFRLLDKQQCRFYAIDPQHGLGDKSLHRRRGEISEFIALFPEGECEI